MKEHVQLPVVKLTNGTLVYEVDERSDRLKFAYTVKRRIPTLGCSGIHVETMDKKTLCYWNGAKVWVDATGR